MPEPSYTLSQVFSPEEIQALFAPTPPAAPPTPGFLGSIIPAMKYTGGYALKGLGSELQDYAGQGPVSSALSSTGEDIMKNNQLSGELLSGRGLGELVGQMAPYVGGGMGGAALGTAVGGPVGGVIGGLLGAALPYQPQSYQTIKDLQHQQGFDNPDAAMMGSILSSAAMGAFGAEGKAVGAIVNNSLKGLPEKELESTLAQLFKQAPMKDGQSIINYYAKELAGTAASGTGMRLGQVATERAFGGAPLTDQGAVSDYLQNAAATGLGSLLMAPIGIRIPKAAEAPKPEEVPAPVETPVTTAITSPEVPKIITNEMPANIEPEMRGVLSPEEQAQKLSESIFQQAGADRTKAVGQEWNQAQQTLEQAHTDLLQRVQDNPAVSQKEEDAATNVLAAANVYDQQPIQSRQASLFEFNDGEIGDAVRGLVKATDLAPDEGRKLATDLLAAYKANPNDFFDKLNTFVRKENTPAQKVEIAPPGQTALFNLAGEPTRQAIPVNPIDKAIKNLQVNNAYEQRGQIGQIQAALIKALQEKKAAQEVPQTTQENANGLQEKGQTPATETPVASAPVTPVEQPIPEVAKVPVQIAKDYYATKDDVESIYGKRIPSWKSIVGKVNRTVDEVTTPKEAKDAYEAYNGTPNTIKILRTVMERRFGPEFDKAQAPVVETPKVPETSIVPAVEAKAPEVAPTLTPVQKIEPAPSTSVAKPATIDEMKRTDLKQYVVKTNRVEFDAQKREWNRGKELPADVARDSVMKDISILKKLLNCLGG